MQRVSIKPRPNWEKDVEAVGLTFHHTDEGKPYWNESAYYQFDMPEVLRVEKATVELQRLALEAGQYIIDNNRFADLGLSETEGKAIAHAWNTEPPALYGRMDLAFAGGHDEPKLLEYNADTPTTLVEAAVAQWHWLQAKFPNLDQFNSLHEQLVAKWRDLIPYLPGGLVHFASVTDAHLEDAMTVTYLADTAMEAGLRAKLLPIDVVGYDSKRHIFVGQDNEPIENLFKLYPWEWMLKEEFGTKAIVASDLGTCRFIEPIWKMMWSNKGILPILWEMFPNHPNLLPAYFDEPRGLSAWAKKPILSREGCNVTIEGRGLATVTKGGPYAGERMVYQGIAPVWNQNGQYAVIGSWLVDGNPAGMGIRESEFKITDNRSCFVPHVIA